MLKWWENCYIGQGIKGPVALRSRINAGKAVPGIYLLTLSENPGNIMEIVPAVVLVQRTAYDLCPLVIGMAKGKEEALEMTRQLIEEIYGLTGGFKVREYIENR